MDSKYQLTNLKDPEARKQLGTWLQQCVQAGLTEKGGLPDRWEVNQGYYLNKPRTWSNRFLPGCEMLHFPLTQPKIDRLAGTVVRTICSFDPMTIAQIRGSGKRVEDVENTFQFFREIGQLEPRMRMLGSMSGVTDCAILRVMFDAVATDALASHPEDVVRIPGLLNYVGFRYDVIHPNDFVIYPSTPYGIQAARIVGHRFWQRVTEVKEKQADGRYFDDVEITGTGNPDEYNSGRDYEFSLISSLIGPDADDALVQCWEVIFKAKLQGDDRERRYIATFVFETGDLLSVEPYRLSRPWYIEWRYKEREYGGYWPSRSVAQDLQGLQKAYNELNNLMIYGSYHAAFPAVFGAGLPAKATKYLAGDVIPADGEITIARNDFNPGMLPLVIERIEGVADAVVRFTQAAVGQQFKAGTTATEVGELLRGQAMNDNDYLVNFGSALLDIAEMEREQIFVHFPLIKQLYGDQVALEDRRTLGMPIRWSLQGKNPSSTPDVMLQKFEALLMKAEQYPDLLDVQEILRSYINAMDLANAYKIMPEEPVMTSGPAAGLEGGDVLDLVPQLLLATGESSSAEQIATDPEIAEAMRAFQ